jgi:putative PEP-CTERM system histidine kinase
LRRPQYDYRKVWKDFTTRTAALVEERPLCETVAKIVAEMFDILSVSIWLLDVTQDKLRCCASTALSPGGAVAPDEVQHEAADILRLLTEQSEYFDIEDLRTQRAAGLEPAQARQLCEARIRYVVPLTGDGGLLGFITLGDCVRYRSLSFEELDLLRSIADQVAAALLNAKLSERLRQAQKMEAFQTMATFFVHDLKNLASKLSMTLHNLPAHFDNPEFRDDALRLLSKSVLQVDDMSRRLSSLREKLEIHPVRTDLNDLVAVTLASLNGLSGEGLGQNLNPVPELFIDPEQIRKVLTNMILNAADAVGEEGTICVSTEARDGWVELGVSDTGCGISQEFMGQCLFQPFKTTKPQGTGIGLFQSKMIVEAHNGHIEVESQEGKGTTFRVLLPMKWGNKEVKSKE